MTFYSEFVWCPFSKESRCCPGIVFLMYDPCSSICELSENHNLFSSDKGQLG